MVIVALDPQCTGVLTVLWTSAQFRYRRRALSLARHFRDLLTGIGYREGYFDVIVESETSSSFGGPEAT